MKKIILFLLVMFISLTSHAEWTYVISTTNHDDYYVDFSTKKTNGNFITVWLKTIYGSTSKEGVSSVKSQEQFDCKNEGYKILYISFFKDKESVKMIGQDFKPDESFQPFPPNSTRWELMKKLCSGKIGK